MNQRVISRTVGLTIIVALMVLVNTSSSLGAPIEQNSIADAEPGATLVVTNTADSGPGTLRQALLNAHTGDTVTFLPLVFPPANPATISLTSGPLPDLDDGNVTIDASTAGVIVDGVGISDPDADGLIVSSIGNTIRGLQVRRFPHIGIHLVVGANNNTIRDNTISSNGDAGISIGGGQGNIITGNRIGTDATGTIARGNHTGILLHEGASSNRIGGVASGERNIIAANQTSGVQIMDAGAMQNLVLGNYIGTDTTGFAALPNGGDGVAISDGAHHNTVGGTTAAERNVIAYNGGSGVVISGNGTTGNTVIGNWIGFGLGSVRPAYPVDQAVSPAYTADCTMFVASLTTGVHKTTDCGATWVERNSGLSETRLLQVEIPPDATNASVAYVLAENGYLFSTTNSGASWSLISTVLEQIDRQNLALSAGFSSDHTMYAAARNWSWDTLGGGPGIFKTTDAGVTWTRQVTGMSDPHVWKVIASPNIALTSTLLALTNSGIEKTTDAGVTWSPIPSPDSSLTDLAFSSAYATDQTLFVSANSGRIYRSTNGGATWTGFDALRWDPRFLAVSPDYSNDHEVYHGGGWNDAVYSSTDSGATWTRASTGLPGGLHEAGSGIVFSPAFASDDTLWVVSVSGMARSTDRGTTWEVMRGLHSPGNTEGVAIRDGAQQNTIGPGNVIGNNGSGVVLESNVGYNVITGNLVGTDMTGTAARANVEDGLSISGHHNTIGGSDGGNLVSGNLVDGIRLAGDQATANIVAGNTIGTTLDGAAALGNRGAGVSIHSGAFLNLVGGMTAAERNLISGNGYGVGLWDTTTMSNTVSGNYIGTNRAGTAALGNGMGIDIHNGAHHNTIGGTTAGEGNLISGNQYDGIALDNSGTVYNAVAGNIIGLAASGAAPVPNGGWGVFIGDGASHNTIGGANAAARNLISNNKWGVGIAGADTANNVIEGNYLSLEFTSQSETSVSQ